MADVVAMTTGGQTDTTYATLSTIVIGLFTLVATLTTMYLIARGSGGRGKNDE